jgi:S-adenosylmethionine decarboxylase
MESNSNHFGEHITIDGYGGDYDLMNSKKHILGFMEDLLKKLEMHKLCEIQIYEAQDNQIKDPGGWSAFVIIAESHISIHTFPKRKFVSADVYTCKNGLDKKNIIDSFVEGFRLEKIESEFVIRGKEYPSNNLV